MGDIKIMSENLANKIAAGEIVQRPYNVIKELVENSIDSQATKIEIDLKESGISEIVIRDNGKGMNKDDLKLSIKRHATSKLYSEEDLFKISTLGFRGEALASIFEVSKMSILTSTNSKDGLKLECIDNDIKISNIAQNKGTTIIVQNLFYNTPARFSALSNPIYELAIITSFVHKINLLYPNLKISLSNNERLVYSSPSSNQITNIMESIYKNNISKYLLTASDSTNNFKVNLYFSGPNVSRNQKNAITISINDRIVQNYKIEKKIVESYKNYLHTNQYPICFIKIDCDYSLVDVNIHPTKQQVHISLLDELLDMIEFNIKSGLRKKEYIQSYESSSVVFEKEEDIDIVLPIKSNVVKNSEMQINLNVVEEEDTSKKDDNISIIKEKYDAQKNNIFDSLKYIGVLHNTYLLFENSEGLHLIDQHAAQERVNYELILDKFENKEYKIQQFLIDNILELSNEMMIDIDIKIEKLKQIGIEAEVFGENSIRIIGVDSFYFKFSNLKNDILNILINYKAKDFSAIFDEIAISLACKSSIKANQLLIDEEIYKLMDDLRKCQDKYTCPHGRPIIVKFSTYEIEKLFKRVF